MIGAPGVLSDVRILDLSRVLAGPFCAQALADLGAEVLKVERPGVGDDTRAWGPPFTKSGDAAYYLAANRNKKSVTIDFTKPEGGELVRGLARRSHIVIENFKTGGLAKYGLDYASLSRDHPGLVYCSITGFGQTGPYCERAGYDFMIQAMGGMMSITGQPDGAPGAEPMKAGVAIADLFTGLYSAIAILGALRHAQATGQGQHIDMALFDCQAAMLANQAMNFFVSGAAPSRMGNAHPNITPYQVFATRDGHLVLAVGNDGQFEAFCASAGLTHLPKDPAFSNNKARVANREALTAALGPVLAGRTTRDWIDALEQAGVPCGPINRIDQVFADAQAQARGLRQTMVRADGEEIALVASPLRLTATPPALDCAPPLLGQDTDHVLSEILGLSGPELQSLRAKGAI